MKKSDLVATSLRGITILAIRIKIIDFFFLTDVTHEVRVPSCEVSSKLISVPVLDLRYCKTYEHASRGQFSTKMVVIGRERTIVSSSPISPIRIKVVK